MPTTGERPRTLEEEILGDKPTADDTDYLTIWENLGNETDSTNNSIQGKLTRIEAAVGTSSVIASQQNVEFTRLINWGETFQLDVDFRTLMGVMNDPDSAPTVWIKDSAGVDWEGSTGTPTAMTKTATGRYVLTKAVTAANPIGTYIGRITIVELTRTRYYDFTFSVNGGDAIPGEIDELEYPSEVVWGDTFQVNLDLRTENGTPAAPDSAPTVWIKDSAAVNWEGTTGVPTAMTLVDSSTGRYVLTKPVTSSHVTGVYVGRITIVENTITRYRDFSFVVRSTATIEELKCVEVVEQGTTFRVDLDLRIPDGTMAAPDSAPTCWIKTPAGADWEGSTGVPTAMTLGDSAGRYYLTKATTVSDAQGTYVGRITIVKNGITRYRDFNFVIGSVGDYPSANATDYSTVLGNLGNIADSSNDSVHKKLNDISAITDHLEELGGTQQVAATDFSSTTQKALLGTIDGGGTFTATAKCGTLTGTEGMTQAELWIWVSVRNWDASDVLALTFVADCTLATASIDEIDTFSYTYAASSTFKRQVFGPFHITTTMGVGMKANWSAGGDASDSVVIDYVIKGGVSG